jgi:hypothetical protein
VALGAQEKGKYSSSTKARVRFSGFPALNGFVLTGVEVIDGSEVRSQLEHPSLTLAWYHVNVGSPVTLQLSVDSKFISSSHVPAIVQGSR